jgi:hypothetical protein
VVALSPAPTPTDETWLHAVANASPIVVAVLALLFTVGSFWWLQARRGKLQTFRPHTFAAAATPDATRLRLPLVFYNTGPKPIVVQNLRLRFPDEPGAQLPLPWTNTRKTLDPVEDDVTDMPAVFAVPGRATVQMFIEFGSPWPGFALGGKEVTTRLETYLAHHGEWRELMTFTLAGQAIAHPDAYIAYANRREQIPEDAPPRAAEGAAKLLAIMQGDDRKSGER